MPIDPNSIKEITNKRRAHGKLSRKEGANILKQLLEKGSTVRSVAESLCYSTKTVNRIRKENYDLFPKRGRPPKPDKIKTVQRQLRLSVDLDEKIVKAANEKEISWKEQVILICEWWAEEEKSKEKL